MIDNSTSHSFRYKLLEISESLKKENVVNIFFYDKETNLDKIEISHKHENVKVVIYISEWKKITLYINDKIIDFAQKVNNNIKKYETFNVVSETGDSIYSSLSKELPVKEKGQVFISEDKIEEIVQEKLDKRLGAIKQEK